MEYWKHPSQGKIESFSDDKHPEKKESLKRQGWFRIKGRGDWAPFQEKKYKKRKRSKSAEIRSRSR